MSTLKDNVLRLDTQTRPNVSTRTPRASNAAAVSLGSELITSPVCLCRYRAKFQGSAPLLTASILSHSGGSSSPLSLGSSPVTSSVAAEKKCIESKKPDTRAMRALQPSGSGPSSASVSISPWVYVAPTTLNRRGRCSPVGGWESGSGNAVAAAAAAATGLTSSGDGQPSKTTSWSPTSGRAWEVPMYPVSVLMKYRCLTRMKLADSWETVPPWGSAMNSRPYSSAASGTPEERDKGVDGPLVGRGIPFRRERRRLPRLHRGTEAFGIGRRLWPDERNGAAGHARRLHHDLAGAAASRARPEADLGRGGAGRVKDVGVRQSDRAVDGDGPVRHPRGGLDLAGIDVAAVEEVQPPERVQVGLAELAVDLLDGQRVVGPDAVPDGRGGRAQGAVDLVSRVRAAFPVEGLQLAEEGLVGEGQHHLDGVEDEAPHAGAGQDLLVAGAHDGAAEDGQRDAVGPAEHKGPLVGEADLLPDPETLEPGPLEELGDAVPGLLVKGQGHRGPGELRVAATGRVGPPGPSFRVHGLLAEMTQRGEGQLAVRVLRPEPHDDVVRPAVDVAHHVDLLVALLEVGLVDAQRVDPQPPGRIAVSEMPQGGGKVRTDVQAGRRGARRRRRGLDDVGVLLPARGRPDVRQALVLELVVVKGDVGVDARQGVQPGRLSAGSVFWISFRVGGNRMADGRRGDRAT
ncbi:hypothetical protein CTA1_7661 [Colletotrichum tanaceti]|uniref:Uncharacterized protein n=1 Tax=Colletotrichum tanaceti TaxID=1306861 RepID=A0A4U6XDZ7_9PEZI|nr:hypothetical protein CTA1_7661 [Colletotrichum tanaceti]